MLHPLPEWRRHLTFLQRLLPLERVSRRSIPFLPARRPAGKMISTGIPRHCKIIRMKSNRAFLPAMACSVGLLLNSDSCRAEAREFTDIAGRTIHGELVSVSGDQVTIKRDDGVAFTVRALNFSKADIEYFKK